MKVIKAEWEASSSGTESLSEGPSFVLTMMEGLVLKAWPSFPHWLRKKTIPESTLAVKAELMYILI